MSDINLFMGYRKLDQVLVYDGLKPGMDPSYELDDPEDVWYLGLAGEMAAEVKCKKITLPMLSKENYNWEEFLPRALKEAISLRPHKHVSCLKAACDDFTKEMFNKGFVEKPEQQPAIWFSDKETWSKTNKYSNEYPTPEDYFSDRCNITLDLPYKTIALIPEPEYFGVLSTNEQFVNFFFIPGMICVYHLDNLSVHEPSHNVTPGVLVQSSLEKAHRSGGDIVLESGSTTGNSGGSITFVTGKTGSTGPG